MALKINKKSEGKRVLPNMTWEIWKIFARALETLKIGTLMGFFFPKLKLYELKIYRGVICHDNEERCKAEKRIDLSFQNWQEEFDKFWLEYSKTLNICPLMGSSWSKYTMFDLKNAVKLCLMTLKIDAKFEGTLICAFKNGMKNLGNFRSEAGKAAFFF